VSAVAVRAIGTIPEPRVQEKGAPTGAPFVFRGRAGPRLRYGREAGSSRAAIAPSVLALPGRNTIPRWAWR